MAELACRSCKQPITKQDEALVVASGWRGPRAFHTHCGDMGAKQAKLAAEAGGFAIPYVIWMVVGLLGVAFFWQDALMRNETAQQVIVAVSLLNFIIHLIFLLDLMRIRKAAGSLP